MSKNKIKPEYLYNVYFQGTGNPDFLPPPFKNLGEHEKDGWNALAVFFKDNLFNEHLK